MPRPITHSGTVLKQMNQLPEAADALRQAIRLDPDFAGAHTTLAAVCANWAIAPARPPKAKLAPR